MTQRYGIVVVCFLAGTLVASCGDISAVADDGGAGKPGADAGRGGGSAAGGAGPGAGGSAVAGAGGAGRGGGIAGSAAGTAGSAAGTGAAGSAGAGGAGRGGGIAGSAAGTAGGSGAGGGPGNGGGAAGTGPAGAGGTAFAGGGRGGAGAGGLAGAGTGAAGTGGGAATCRRELLTNGDFDLAMTSWNEAPQGTALVRRSGDAELASDQITPQSGLYVLRLGAPSDNKYVVHYVEQHADIPTGALEVTISGYLQVRTEEPPDDVYDEAYVQLSAEATPASPFFRSGPWTNLTQANSWTPFSFPVNVATIAGKQMIFRIVADLDTSTPTYFYFDTVSVSVTRCAP
jgi:hypothetical protein